MQDFVGKQIDRYRITERLGVGGMAMVYKAYDTRLERDVAFKLIRTEAIPQEQHPRLLKRFEREAKAQARFSHPNIVPVYDYGEVNGSPYIVMEYIPGGTLKERTGEPVDVQKALTWLAPMADALAYAHEEGIVHRDIKPSNILFDKKGRPILTDFGIAKILETDEATLTGTGMGVGTPEYMAPEQWQGKVSEATDQYALGVVLYELLTGQKPYQADTPAALVILQATEPLRAPSRLVVGISESLEKVLYKALARDPGDRFEDMKAFKRALLGLLVGKGAKVPEPVKRVQPPAKPSHKPVVNSEGETWDALDPTPVETNVQKGAVKLDSRKARPGKSLFARLPKWTLWVGATMIGLGIIGLMIGKGGNLVSIGKGGEGPLAMLATATSTVTPTQTATNTMTLTQIPTITLTPTWTMTTTETMISTQTRTLSVGSTLINKMDGAEMVYVPEGEFLMGSEDSDADSDEAPEHTVYLDTYWIYKYEVTNAQYRQCIEAGSCSGSLNSYPEDNYPAVYIDWSEADTYCEWAGGRLPTEAEWEKAARGTAGRTYPWGEVNPTCNLAQFFYCFGDPVQVGRFPNGASPYGALDMAGNVWEWVADWYDGDYYAISPGSNPIGPESSTARVVRGGSVYDIERILRASNRFSERPDLSHSYYGFRCVRSEAPSN